jgi:hypothetical protein
VAVRPKVHPAKRTRPFMILKKSVNWVRQNELVWMLDIINLPLHHGDERLGSPMAASDILDQCASASHDCSEYQIFSAKHCGADYQHAAVHSAQA